MRSFSSLVFLAAVAAVQSTTTSSSTTSSSSTPTSTASPLIPTGISAGCSSFLTSLNSDATLAQCIAPIISATSAFGPTGKTGTNVTTASVQSALNTLCSSSSNTTCSETTVRAQLANFYSACQTELTSDVNKDVLLRYDVLYALMPFKDAVCTKNDSGDFCILQNTAGSSSGSKVAVSGSQSIPELLSNNLWTPVSSDTPSGVSARALSVQNQTAFLVPNATTYQATGVPFLLLTPNMDANSLCVSCTRAILSAYISFEQQLPYAAGLGASPLLSGQLALYTAVNSTCGSAFMSGAVQAAGGLSGGLTGGAMQLSAGEITSFGTLVAAVAAGFVAVL